MVRFKCGEGILVTSFACRVEETTEREVVGVLAVEGVRSRDRAGLRRWEEEGT